MSDTLRLNKDLARELTYENEITAGGDTYRVLRNEWVESTRWTAVYELVIQINDTRSCWATTYERGLTEMQDTTPFDDEGPVVEFHKVYPHTVTTIEYRDKP